MNTSYKSRSLFSMAGSFLAMWLQNHNNSMKKTRIDLKSK